VKSPDPAIAFDPDIHVSPFELFRALMEGRPLALVDVRRHPERLTLQGAMPLAETDNLPPSTELVLFDDDGELAESSVVELRGSGHPRCRALYGGLLVYELAIVPEVVGAQTFLARLGG
jgi:hypothetical protein